MAIGSGIAGQIGLAAEASYNAYQAPAVFYEFDKESIEAELQTLEARGIGQGRRLKFGRTKRYTKASGGGLEVTLLTKGGGLLMQHALGTYANSLVAGSERQELITPDDTAGKLGKYLTVQVGRPDVGGTVRAMSYTGGKVTTWEFKAAKDDFLRFMVDLDFAAVTTAQALGTASYPAGTEGYVFSEGAVTLNGASISVASLSIKGEESLATERRFIGNAKKEPIANGEAVISGELEFEFEDLTQYNRVIAANEVANLVAVFTTPTIIAGGGAAKITLTVPLIRFDTGAPKVESEDIIPLTAGFKAVNDGANPVFSVNRRTTDTVAS